MNAGGHVPRKLESWKRKEKVQTWTTCEELRGYERSQKGLGEIHESTKGRETVIGMERGRQTALLPLAEKVKRVRADRNGGGGLGGSLKLLGTLLLFIYECSGLGSA